MGGGYRSHYNIVQYGRYMAQTGFSHSDLIWRNIQYWSVSNKHNEIINKKVAVTEKEQYNISQFQTSLPVNVLICGVQYIRVC